MSFIDTTRSSWGGSLWPPQVYDRLLNELLEGAPFSNSLTRFPTSAASVVFPRTAPEPGKWLFEGERIPRVSLNDSADVVAVCKLASLHNVPNEAFDDASYPLVQEIGRMLQAADGPELDRALLYGQGDEDAREPAGVVAKAQEAEEPALDLREGVIRAWSELLSVGASPTATRVYVHPLQLGIEWSRTAPAAGGMPIHQDQPSAATLFLGPGIPVTAVPTLQTDDILAVDVGAVYFIIRENLGFEMSEAGEAWEHDSQSIRVKLRAAVGAPLPAKSLRRVTLADRLEVKLGTPVTAEVTNAQAEAEAPPQAQPPQRQAQRPASSTRR